MAASQTRVVLRGTALERGEYLLNVTRLGSLSELINVMFTRYGKHLEKTWEVQPIEGSGLAASESQPEVGLPANPNKNLPEPITGL